MNETVRSEGESAVWGRYPNYDDIARFEYGRRMWRLPEMRARLLRHWTDPQHPYSDRFNEQRQLIQEVRGSVQSPANLDRDVRVRGTSLRCLAGEIPPVFGSFF